MKKGKKNLKKINENQRYHSITKENWKTKDKINENAEEKSKKMKKKERAGEL